MDRKQSQRCSQAGGAVPKTDSGTSAIAGPAFWANGAIRMVHATPDPKRSCNRSAKQATSLALDERQQVSVDRLRVCSGHAVRKVLVRFQRAVLQQLCRQRP